MGDGGGEWGWGIGGGGADAGYALHHLWPLGFRGKVARTLMFPKGQSQSNNAKPPPNPAPAAATV